MSCQVCYIVDMVIVTAESSNLERVVFFGDLDQVLKDLDVAEKTQSQAMLVHAADPLVVAVAGAKIQVIRQLMNHDLNEIPKYPVFAIGTHKMKDSLHPVAFQIHIRVSVRGDVEQSLNKRLNILLPPGVI